MLLHHVTLSTGHTCTHRLDLIPQNVVEICEALLPNGGPVPSFPALYVTIDTPFFTICHGTEPVVTCGMGIGADENWLKLCQFQAQFLPVRATPPRSRWLAAVLLPGLQRLNLDYVLCLGDFERCLACAMLKQAPLLRS